MCQPEHEQHPGGGKDCNYQRRTGSVDSREEELKATEAVSFFHRTHTQRLPGSRQEAFADNHVEVNNLYIFVHVLPC